MVMLEPGNDLFLVISRQLWLSFDAAQLEHWKPESIKILPSEYLYGLLNGIDTLNTVNKGHLLRACLFFSLLFFFLSGLEMRR